MKQLAGIALLLCSIQICQGQTLATVYDADGKEVGQPMSQPDFGLTSAVIFRPDSLVTTVDFITGELVFFFPIRYEGTFCDGQAYVGGFNSNPYNFLVTERTADKPNPVYVTNRNSVYEVRELNSIKNLNGCDTYQRSISSEVAPISPVNPTDYGLTLTPSGEWGYKPPLVVKAIDLSSVGDAIFCNSFENCPTQ